MATTKGGGFVVSGVEGEERVEAGGEKAPEASQELYIASSSTAGSKALGSSPSCSVVGAALTAEAEVEEVEAEERRRRSSGDDDAGHGDDVDVECKLLAFLAAAISSVLRPVAWISAARKCLAARGCKSDNARRFRGPNELAEMRKKRRGSGDGRRQSRRRRSHRSHCSRRQQRGADDSFQSEESSKSRCGSAGHELRERWMRESARKALRASCHQFV